MSNFQVPVGISNRHAHLSQQDIETLFGSGYELTKMKDLSQPGQYACEETISVIGPKGTLEGVRILGPARKASQVELSVTDTFKVGVKVFVRDSGNLDGTPCAEIVGPKGRVSLDAGVIVAARHIHMHTEDAQKYQLHDGDRVRVNIGGPRGGSFTEVLVRVNPAYALDFHVDTDEGNAFLLKNGQTVEVIPEA